MTRPPRSAGRTRSRRRPSGRRARPAGSDDKPGAEPGIEISNRQSHVKTSAAYLRKVVRAVLDAEQVTSAGISVALADNAIVRRVNREYLQHDYDTDVLSFLFESTDDGTGRRKADRRIEGEVLVSAEMAVQMAGEFGWTPRDELTLYLVHGLLHLCGYDDLAPAKRRIMRGRERAILAELGIQMPETDERDRSARAKRGTNGRRS